MRIPPLLALAALLSGAAVSAQSSVTVAPSLETQPDPVLTGGQLRDVALWVNPADGGASLLFTAYNSPNAGLVTFGMDGQQLEAEVTDGPTLSVAVRDEFPLAGGSRTLVVTANPNFNGLAAYQVDAQGADRLVRIGPTGFVTGTAYSAVTLYRSADSGRFYVFAGTQGGRLDQFELSGADGGVTANPVRTLRAAGGGIAGVVADEEARLLFVTEEGQGLWRYSAEPNGGQTRTQVAAPGGGQLTATAGRVALYRAGNGEGYLIVADTGADAFVVFERRSQAFVGRFLMGTDGGIDRVEDPVALAVSSRPAGPTFPDGLFVAHDGLNNGPDNLKLASWSAVAGAFTPPLRIDTRQNTDGGTDGGAGEADAGPRPIVDPPPPGPGLDDGNGCSCASASVPATALLGLLALVLAGRRRRH
jgi:3-phytase